LFLSASPLLSESRIYADYTDYADFFSPTHLVLSPLLSFRRKLFGKAQDTLLLHDKSGLDALMVASCILAFVEGGTHYPGKYGFSTRSFLVTCQIVSS
jgi:hypothetical protein